MLIGIRPIFNKPYGPLDLQVFREQDTGVVRLQASETSMALDRIPVWTAFITHQMLSLTWASRVSPRAVLVADLQQYIFSSQYNPRKMSTGFELKFVRPGGKVPILVGVVVYANRIRC